MKRIGDYRRLLGITNTAGLKELKTVYRDFMKENHPDKFVENNSLKLEAEEKSKSIIAAYHFLVSIDPETQKQNLPEYTATITSSIIVDFQHKGLTLKINFSDGSVYEYFNVPKNIYIKLVNADSQGRFARRHIFSSYLYRNITKATAV
ncbi:MAG: KTSC domain-containing protein [Bacteroidetes bacterium]|nr:KTSC domain-containing protein [Bacteroidota bacterium]